MIQLFIPKSRSVKFDSAIKQAGALGVLTESETGFILEMEIKKMFENWDGFNLLFWATVDWKGTYVKVMETSFYSHTDKTAIFYSLQLAHMKWLAIATGQLMQYHNVASGSLTIEQIEKEFMKESAIDEILDLLYPPKK